MNTRRGAFEENMLNALRAGRNDPALGEELSRLRADNALMRIALADITEDGPIWRAQRIARETLAALSTSDAISNKGG